MSIKHQSKTIQSRNTAAESSNSEDLIKIGNFINKIKFSPKGPTYEFNKSDFQEIQIINSSKNVVKLFLHKLSGFRFAVKQINIPHNRNNEGEYDKQLIQLIREVQSLALLQNTLKIVQFYGACECEKQIWICMEAMDMSLKDLYTKIHQEFKHFPEELIGCIVVAIIDALEFCNVKEIIHRDIKPENVLLNKTGEIKLSDFGESRVTENSLAISHRIGTINYWPPERFKPGTYDSRSDIWSLGITLIEIIVGQFPYKLIREDILKNSILLQNLIMEIDPKRLVEMIDLSYSKELTDFIQLCLNPVELRPKYHELKETEFYRRYADKTREDVEKIIGRLDVPVHKCQSTTVTDHGYCTGSHYPNEKDNNVESESSLAKDTSINELMSIKSESSMGTWGILETENEDVLISSSSSTSSVGRKKLVTLSIDNEPECKHHEDTITETREKPYALGYIPKMKKSMSTSNLTDMELPNFPLQPSISLDTFKILSDLYGKWGENNFHRIYTSMMYENTVNRGGGTNFGANPWNNSPNQGGGFPQGDRDPYWQHNNQRGRPPIPPNTQICITPNCKEKNKTCFCQHCPLRRQDERLMQANILLPLGILCPHKCCEKLTKNLKQPQTSKNADLSNYKPPMFPTQPPPQQLTRSSPYQHVPLSFVPSTSAINQPYAQHCPSMSTQNNMGENQFPPCQHLINPSLKPTFVGQAFPDSNQPNMQYGPPITLQSTTILNDPINTPIHNFCSPQQPQFVTQQNPNTGQAYTVPEQNLIQNYQINCPRGNDIQPNFNGASSRQPHQNGQQNAIQQQKPKRNNRVYEQQHRERKRIFLENLETKLKQLEASNREILNLLKNLNLQPNFPIQPAHMPQEQVPLAIGNQPPSFNQQMGPNPGNIPGTSHPPTTALPEGYPVIHPEHQQPLYTNGHQLYTNGNLMAMAIEPCFLDLSNGSPRDFTHLNPMKNPNQAEEPQNPPSFDPLKRNE